MKKANLLWIDLEMTGLDPVKDRIIEVGVIATDWRLNEVARYTAAIKVNPRLAKRRMTGDFWEKNMAVREALFEASQTSGRVVRTVENELIDFLKKNFDMKQPIYLAGNSVWNDRQFIERQWSRLNNLLHYRMLDVTAWKLVFENHFRTKINKPEIHRALDDIEGSIAELKLYMNRIKL
ncbi:oligoribonuclease [Candidatus Saccharibacteria bacterium]|nr:oligoribonuclease [Candidatus Saccharibacteria bacterium]